MWRLFSAQESRAAFAPVALRPGGVVIWLHCACRGSALELVRLCERLLLQNHAFGVVVTAAEGVELPVPLPAGFFHQPMGGDAREVGAFLAHWAPAVGLWSCGAPPLGVLEQALSCDVPLVLLAAEEKHLSAVRHGMTGRSVRKSLRRLAFCCATTEEAARLLRRAGVERGRLHVTGPLQWGGPVASCDDIARSALAEALAGRQMWLACDVSAGEALPISNAHRRAVRFAHRLLLVAMPDDETSACALAASFEAEGWRVAHWADDQPPGEMTQVLLVDHGLADPGLWLRLAPVVFLGNSLEPGALGCDPLAAAGLGSAILHGPHVAAYSQIYTPLRAAGGALMVQDDETLAEAVVRLISPERAAQMAHAAWEVFSRGAEATDGVIDLVVQLLDEQAEGG